MIMKPAAPVGRTGPHSASKRGHTHISETPVNRYAAAQQWAADTGRPIPPHMRARGQLRDVEPMSVADRLAGYIGPTWNSVEIGTWLCTPAQRRRTLHKLRRRVSRTQNVQVRERLAQQLDELERWL